MDLKKKITISMSPDILDMVDSKVDKINFKNRSNVIEQFVRSGLSLKDDIGAIILTHESKWDDGGYPFDIPKILLKINGKTLLENYFKEIKNAGIKKCVLVLGDFSNQIEEYIKNNNFGLDIEFVYVDSDTESQKAIYLGSRKIDTNKNLIFLGDGYFEDLSLVDFIHYHNNSDQKVSLVVKMIEASRGFGNVKMKGNSIIGFIEKPEKKEDLSFLVNAGIYLIESSLIPKTKDNFKIEKNYFPELVKKEKVGGYILNGDWQHIQSSKVYNLLK